VPIKLYGYWRSSAAYRVRIALNLKGIDYETVPVSLVAEGGEHRKHAYRERNPQMLVPFFEDGEVTIGQSQAILEYLEEVYPKISLLPDTAEKRAAVRALCNLICCDIHPLNNLRVIGYLKNTVNATELQRGAWYAHWIDTGFSAAETILTVSGLGDPYAFGNEPTLADVCLVPQMYNARRFNVPVDDYPTLSAITDACNELDAFKQAAPESQPDAKSINA